MALGLNPTLCSTGTPRLAGPQVLPGCQGLEQLARGQAAWEGSTAGPTQALGEAG